MPIEWEFDQAASGPRLRAFPGRGHLIAYADGRWYIELSYKGAQASGKETDQERAKKRAEQVYAAMATDIEFTVVVHPSIW
jgi:hypothetical protein